MAVSLAPTTGRIIDNMTVPADRAGTEASRLPLLVHNPRCHADHPLADGGQGSSGSGDRNCVHPSVPSRGLTFTPRPDGR